MDFIPYVFYRYRVFDIRDDRTLTPKQFWTLLCKNTNIEVAYRKSDPSESDKDTSWVEPDENTLSHNGGKNKIFTCQIARHITSRRAKQYDKGNDKIFFEERSTDEYATSRAVFVPSVGIVGFSDKSGDGNINAQSAASRFATIARTLHYTGCEISLAATSTDLENALKNWELSDFSFTARPFNPTVRTPGDKLHPLLHNDNAKIVGHARPNKKTALVVSDDGFINEVAGLARRGYAEYGATGKTPSGYIAKIAKSKNPEKIERQIKIYIPFEGSLNNHILGVAKTALETYTPHEQ